MKEQLEEFCTFLTEKKVIKKTVDQEDIIRKFIKLHTDRRFGLTDIVQIVSLETGVPLISMKQKTRKREIVESRQIAMWMLKRYTKLSLEAIGSYFENENEHIFDHSTVLHACKTVNDLKETNRDFREKFEKAKKAVEKSKEKKAEIQEIKTE